MIIDTDVVSLSRALVEKIRECAFDGTGESVAHAPWAVVYMKDINEELERLESALNTD